MSLCRLFPLSMPYAWRITKDYLDLDDPEMSNVGVTGPSDAPADLLALLDAGKGQTFDLYDDDGEHYVRGLLVVRGDLADADEDVLEAPLTDYGYGGLGAVTVKYHGHPEWEIG